MFPIAVPLALVPTFTPGFAPGFAPGHAQAQDVPWRVGQPVGHVHLPTLEGEELDLTAFLGRKLLLIEFASW